MLPRQVHEGTASNFNGRDSVSLTFAFHRMDQNRQLPFLGDVCDYYVVVDYLYPTAPCRAGAFYNSPLQWPQGRANEI